MVDHVPVTNGNFLSRSLGRRRDGKEGNYFECGVYRGFRMLILKI